MKIESKRKLLKAQLNENLTDLAKSLQALIYSYDTCRHMKEKAGYDMEEQVHFEALTSRFARTADILTQKLFKTLFSLLQENLKTIIDAANFVEKLGIVKHADIILQIRELRNQIAHEYVNADLNALFLDVLQYVPQLEEVVASLKAYIANLMAKIPD